jgi:hypothetical protein
MMLMYPDSSIQRISIVFSRAATSYSRIQIQIMTMTKSSHTRQAPTLSPHWTSSQNSDNHL